jgi:hypothetical protein
MNPEIPVENLKKDGYQVYPYEKKIEGNVARELPDPVKRNQILTEAGLEKTISKWDHLERDMLYMRARAMPLKELQTKYPKLPKRSLEKLKALIDQSEGAK